MYALGVVSQFFFRCTSISRSDDCHWLTDRLTDWKFSVLYYLRSYHLYWDKDGTDWKEWWDWINWRDWIDWIDYINLIDWTDWIDWIDWIYWIDKYTKYTE